MGFNYDPDALPQVVQSIEAIEEYVAGNPARIAMFEEIANQSGAKKFQENIEVLKTASNALCKMLKDFIGEDGDKAAEGTLRGAVTTMKKLDATMNG